MTPEPYRDQYNLGQETEARVAITVADEELPKLALKAYSTRHPAYIPDDAGVAERETACDRREFMTYLRSRQRAIEVLEEYV